MTDKPELEFVNDWSELERAAEVLKEHLAWYDQLSHADPLDDNPELVWAMDVLVDYVPRLLTQYASLLETSYALVEGWEAYAKVNAPTGILVPDRR